jgi:hypothetical protein
MRGEDMKRLPRKLTIAWLLVTAFLVVSIWGVGWYGETWVAELDNGNVNVEWSVDPFWIFGRGFVHGTHDTEFRLLPRFERHHYDKAALSSPPFGFLGAGDDRRVVLVPLWLSWLFLTGITGWIIWKNRCRLLGHCRHCGYSLTGNTSGVCPECGTRVSSAPDAPAR